MTKILPHRNKRDNIIIVIVSLITSIVITNSFIIFSPDEDSRFYFSGLTSSFAIAVGLVISIVMVYRYKISIKKQKEMQQVLLNRNDILTLIIIMIITKFISLFVYFLHSDQQLRSIGFLKIKKPLVFLQLIFFTIWDMHHLVISYTVCIIIFLGGNLNHSFLF